MKGKFIGQVGDFCYLIWQGYEQSVKQYQYYYMLFESKFKDVCDIWSEVSDDFLSNNFKEPILCQIESIVYEFPSALTIAYLKKQDMNVEERILQWIVLWY